MFGIYNVGLALLVLLSHSGVTIYGHNLGALAVVSFFLISGYTVTFKFKSKAPLNAKVLRHFYTDRFFRLYPVYFGVLVLSYLTIKLNFLHFSILDLGVKNILFNLIIIPLDYWKYIDMRVIVINNVPYNALIPPAWWLALEIQFYLISPFIVKFRNLRISLFCLSLMVWLLAAIGILDTPFFGYHLLPGIMFIYILGLEMQLCRKKRRMSKLLHLTWWGALMTMLFLASIGGLQIIYNFEVLTGLLIGIPVVRYLSRLPYDKGGLDTQIGKLAYPIFISHFLVIWLVAKNYGYLPINNQRLMTVIDTIAFSVVLYILIDQKVGRWRQQYQAKEIKNWNTRIQRIVINEKRERKIPDYKE
jgi:peptidoglycan/LPS O-acetylase OafA/YrhL